MSGPSIKKFVTPSQKKASTYGIPNGNPKKIPYALGNKKIYYE